MSENKSVAELYVEKLGLASSKAMDPLDTAPTITITSAGHGAFDVAMNDIHLTTAYVRLQPEYLMRLADKWREQFAPANLGEPFNCAIVLNLNGGGASYAITNVTKERIDIGHRHDIADVQAALAMMNRPGQSPTTPTP